MLTKLYFKLLHKVYDHLEAHLCDHSPLYRFNTPTKVNYYNKQGNLLSSQIVYPNDVCNGELLIDLIGGQQSVHDLEHFIGLYSPYMQTQFCFHFTVEYQDSWETNNG